MSIFVVSIRTCSGWIIRRGFTVRMFVGLACVGSPGFGIRGADGAGFRCWILGGFVGLWRLWILCAWGGGLGGW